MHVPANLLILVLLCNDNVLGFLLIFLLIYVFSKLFSKDAQQGRPSCHGAHWSFLGQLAHGPSQTNPCHLNGYDLYLIEKAQFSWFCSQSYLILNGKETFKIIVACSLHSLNYFYVIKTNFLLQSFFCTKRITGLSTVV